MSSAACLVAAFGVILVDLEQHPLAPQAPLIQHLLDPLRLADVLSRRECGLVEGWGVALLEVEVLDVADLPVIGEESHKSHCVQQC